MRATEICGEVFCEIWAVFLTVWLVVRNATLHHPECHTSTRQTPHLTKANATLEHSRNAAFTLSKCGISDDEVWHSGQQATRLKKQPIFRKKLPRIFP